MKLLPWSRLLILTAGAVFLSSCAPSEQQIIQQQRSAQAEIEQCRAMGAVTHADFTRCQNNRYQQREATNRAQRQAIGRALLAGNQSRPQNKAACFKQSDAVSGFNRICYYNCGGSIEARTIPSTQLCPLS